MPQLGPMEVLIVAVIALVVFGPHRLPEMARTVGKFIAEFRRQANELSNEFKLGLDDEDDEPPGEERFDTDLRFDEDGDEDEPAGLERSDGELAFENENENEEDEEDENVHSTGVAAAPPETPEAAHDRGDRHAASDLNGRKAPQAASPVGGTRETTDEDAAEDRS